MALGNTSEAVDIAWVVLQRQWVDDHQVKEIIAEETDVQGGTEATRKRLKYQLDKSPKNYMAKDTLAYLELISAAERQDFEYIVTVLPRVGTLRTSGNRSQKWLSENSSLLLTQNAQNAMPVLLGLQSLNLTVGKFHDALHLE